MAERKPVRFLELIRTLVEADVDFLVVGGVAAVLEGAPVSTFDLDVVYSTDEANVERLHNALEALDARYVDPAGRSLQPDADALKRGGHHLFRTNFGRLDLLSSVGEDSTFADLEEETVEHSLHGIAVRVLPLRQVIAIKEAANRPKDRAVLELLRATLAERERD